MPCRARRHGDDLGCVGRIRARLALSDAIHGDYGPGIDYPTETDRRRLLRRAEAAIEALAMHGVDELSVELLLVMLGDADELEADGGADSAPPG